LKIISQPIGIQKYWMQIKTLLNNIKQLNKN